MTTGTPLRRAAVGVALVATWLMLPAQPRGADAIDDKVKAVLDSMRGQWRDMNVPEVDGRILHDLILQRRFTKALEIGTSTGHSGLWIGWALSKTGGRLVTIEIDEQRHRQATALFARAGLGAVIEARRADAHELVPRLEGPYDFVFIDADKDWYTAYAKAIIPRLTASACLTAHNVPVPGPPGRTRSGMRGTAEFYQFMLAQPGFDSRVHPDSRAGVSISCR